MHLSVATIDKPELINLQPNDINQNMLNCEIKVLYVGENRNRTFISKEVAQEMAKSLRGVPIVGYYIEEQGDFGDHAKEIIIDDKNGIQINSKTIPYGFVAPDAKVWFQTFDDLNEKTGETVKREYLVTNGYLWIEQLKSNNKDFQKGQSMELGDDMSGYWTKAINNNYELFIINDATFSKLCILGDNVEPCFEGASIKATPTGNYSFSQTLFSMIEDLKNVLERRENNLVELENNGIVTPVDAPAAEAEKKVEENIAVADNSNQETSTENENTTEVKEELPPVTEEPVTAFVVEKTPSEEFTSLQNEYTALKTQYEELNSKYEALNKECEELKQFKLNAENKEKDELINSFYMLSDEDKKEVIENKQNYSLNDIEAKLSIMCVRKKVSFTKEEEKTPIAAYSFNSNNEESSLPAYIAALKNTRDSKNN